MTTAEMLTRLEQNEFSEIFETLYGNDITAISYQKERYKKAINAFTALYGDGKSISLYSAPGRTEICGNHTDHQGGVVISASVDADIIAVASRNNSDVIRLKSEGYNKDEININDTDIKENEKGRAISLIRGVVAKIKAMGHEVQGLDIYTTSNVLKGSGLSSSAAFEVCLGRILNEEFCGGELSPIELAQIGQYAENEYFGKPSGLMDQLTCSVGGAVFMDFSSAENPTAVQQKFDLAELGYKLIVTDTKGNHAGLTSEYSSIRKDMDSVATFLGKSILSETNEDDFYNNIPKIRNKLGDRAIIRAHHYYSECSRVYALKDAIANKNADEIMSIILNSGKSSFMYNQNAYVPSDIHQQEIPVALAVSEKIIGNDGAYRLQGGGFAGTIQAFVKEDNVDKYRKALEGLFGKGACFIMNIRPVGSVKVG